MSTYLLYNVIVGNKSTSEIFVVDDDSSIGDGIAGLLRLKGYRVKSFVKGSDAIKKAKESKPDLALIDYLLPGEKTEDVIRDFHDIPGEDLPIILMSASTQAAQKAKTLPVAEFIAKPFQIELLLETVERNIN